MSMTYVGYIELYPINYTSLYSGNVQIDFRNRNLYSTDRINTVYGGGISRVSLDTFTKTGQLIPTGWLNNGIWSGGDIIDQEAGFLYCGGDSGADNVNTITKIRLSDFSVVDTLTLNADETDIWFASIDTKNHLAYFGCNYLRTLIKVDLLTFTRTGSIELGTTTRGLSSVIDENSGFIYIAKHAVTGNISKIRLSDFTVVDTLTLDTNENAIMSSMINPGTNKAYFMSGSSTAPNLIEIALATFTRTNTLTISVGDLMRPRAAALSQNGFVYVVKTYNTNNGASVIHKVRLSDFTVIESLTLPMTGTVLSNNSHYNSCAIDPLGGCLYLTDTYTGTADTTVNRLIKIYDSDILSGTTPAPGGRKRRRLF